MEFSQVFADPFFDAPVGRVIVAGRDGYASEQILRALIVMMAEGQDYRGTVVGIDTSEFLQLFVRLGVERKHYVASVGLAVLCHNLVLLTRL